MSQTGGGENKFRYYYQNKKKREHPKQDTPSYIGYTSALQGNMLIYRFLQFFYLCLCSFISE